MQNIWEGFIPTWKIKLHALLSWKFLFLAVLMLRTNALVSMNLEFDKVRIQQNMPFTLLKKFGKINFNLLKKSVQAYTWTFNKISRSFC